MRVSCFPRLQDASCYVANLPSIASLIAEVRVVERKEDAQLFSPTTFTGNYRRNANADYVHFGVVEFDKVTQADRDRVVEHLAHSGISFVYYTTFSHDPANGKWNFRIAVPFVEPVPAHVWTVHYWPKLIAFVCPKDLTFSPDPACKDAARIYFEPSYPEARSQYAEQFFVEGQPLDMEVTHGARTDVADSASSEQPKTASGKKRLNHDDLQEYYRKIKRREGACALSATACLKAVLKGDAWGDKDTRNDRISNLCYELMKDFPDLDPDQVAQLFTPSCLLIQKQDAEAAKYTPEFIAAKLREKTRYIEERQRQYARDNHEVYLDRLQRIGFEGPYTPMEMAALEQQEVHPAGWLLQQENGAWVFTKKYGYRFFRGVGPSKNAAQQNLLPAKIYGIVTEQYESKAGAYKVLPLDELVQRYGSVPDKIVGSLVAQESRYRSETRTFTIAECPLRQLEPKYDARIAAWLKLLGGDKHGQLEKWIAWATHLDRPCAMLVLSGPTGSGKSLFANGLARLWTHQEATPLHDALDNFNARIAQCPLLFADEKVPKDRDGRHRFDDLRELVTKRTFVLNEKNIAKREVDGAVRIIVAVNALSLLVGETPESVQELKATLERIVHVVPHDDTPAFLDALRVEGQQWEPDTIAEHALWLKSQIPLPVFPPRFLFAPEVQHELANAFVSASSMYGAICQWLIAFLREPRKVYQGVTTPRDPVWRIKVTMNGFFATAQAVQAHWVVYGDKRPWQRAVQNAWLGLRAHRSSIETPSGVAHTEAIDIERLITWAEENTVADRQEIVELFQDYIDKDVYGHAERALKQQLELSSGLRSIPRPVPLRS